MPASTGQRRLSLDDGVSHQRVDLLANHPVRNRCRLLGIGHHHAGCRENDASVLRSTPEAEESASSDLGLERRNNRWESSQPSRSTSDAPQGLRIVEHRGSGVNDYIGPETRQSREANCA